MSIVETERNGRIVHYSPKPCVECGSEFIPTSGTQKFDLTCEPIVRARRRREKYNTDENYRRRLIALNYRSELRRKGKNPDSAVVPPRIEPPLEAFQEIRPNTTETEVISGDILAIEAEFSKSAKMLQKKGYTAPMPIFREGEDRDGTQVYFSPQGYLCYKPIGREFRIETDVAVDIYGKERILQSLTSALSLRKI